MVSANITSLGLFTIEIALSCFADYQYTLACKVTVMNKSNSSCPVFLPDNLEIDAILPPDNYRKDKYANIKAAVYYIISSIIHMSQNRKSRDYFEQYGGFPLHAETLNGILGKRYKEALTILEDTKVIERVGGYTPGEHSSMFRLCEPYASANIIVKNIPIDAKGILAKIQDYRKKDEEKNKEALDKIPFITKWFDRNHLSITANASHTFIEYYIAELIGLIPSVIPKGRTRDEIISRINQKGNNMIDSVNGFLASDMRLTKTGKDKRLHSFLSNTKKELRTLYTFDGKPLVSVDLKSSQPYLLSHLMNPEFWKKEFKEILPEIYEDYPEDISSIISQILMLVTLKDNNAHANLKKDGFSHVDWTNDFYSYLIDQAKVAGQPELFPDRNTTKGKMMMILYDDGDYKDSEPSFKFFSKLFPREAALIKYFKELTRRKKASKSKDDNQVENYLPILLQRLESKFILEHICKKISEEYPDAPLLPVHDCINTTQEYADVVKGIMIRELKQQTGIEPGVKLEEYNKARTLEELSSLAKRDMDNILRKKTKYPFLVNIKPPLIVAVPEKDGDWLVSDRYIYPDYKEDINTPAKLIRVVDDRKSIKKDKENNVE